MAKEKSRDEELEEENARQYKSLEDDYHFGMASRSTVSIGMWKSMTDGKLDGHFNDISPSIQSQVEDHLSIIDTGASAQVYKIKVLNLTLAKKSIWKPSQEAISRIKSEAKIVRSVDKHHHVLKLVAAYEGGFKGGFSFHILSFPVAVCNLQKFLDDCDTLQRPEKFGINHFYDIRERLAGLGISGNASFEDLKRVSKTGNGVLPIMLSEMMGCLASTMAWIHASLVEHRDLKPQNILLGPGRGRLYITDFGISRQRQVTDRTTTELYSGHTKGYAAPEVVKGDLINPKQADVYSLGCVFLQVYSATLKDSWPKRDAVLQFFNMLLRNDTDTAQCLNVKLPSAGEKRRVTGMRSMIMAMLRTERALRPTMAEVNQYLLVDIRNKHKSSYHGQCCMEAAVGPQ